MLLLCWMQLRKDGTFYALSRIIVEAQQYLSWRILVNNFRAPQCLSVYWVFDFRIIMISPKNFWYSWVIRLVPHPSYPQGSTRIFFDSVLHLNKSKTGKKKNKTSLHFQCFFFGGGGVSGLRVLYFFMVPQVFETSSQNAPGFGIHAACHWDWHGCYLASRCKGFDGF